MKDESTDPVQCPDFARVQAAREQLARARPLIDHNASITCRSDRGRLAWVLRYREVDKDGIRHHRSRRIAHPGDARAYLMVLAEWRDERQRKRHLEARWRQFMKDRLRAWQMTVDLWQVSGRVKQRAMSDMRRAVRSDSPFNVLVVLHRSVAHYLEPERHPQRNLLRWM